MANKIVSLVTYVETDDLWNVTFHGSKREANKAAEALIYDLGWVVEKLEDITAEDQPMTIGHLTSFIRQFISEEKVTENLADAQNVVWSYLASGGDTAGSAAPETAASAPGEPGRGEVAMAATEAGTEARRRPARRVTAKKAKVAKKSAAKKSAAKKDGKVRETRTDSKVAKVISMMRRERGATVAEIAKELEWETKSVHGVVSGILRKKMNLKPTVEKVDNRGNVYHLPAA